MSRDLADSGGIYISAYAGPARLDGGPRTRVQITNRNDPKIGGDMITLSLQEWGWLIQAIRKAIRQGFTTSTQE